MDQGGTRTVIYIAAAVATALIALVTLPAVLVADRDAAAADLTGEVNSDAIPAEFRDSVLKAGQRCKEISASVLAAQIDSESGWNLRATSPAGAQGISRFMPGTWNTWGKDYSGDGRVDVFDPHDSIGSQADLMCALARQVRDKIRLRVISGEPLELTLAAYNAGMGNVVAAKGVPPFPETTAYIRKILDASAKKYSLDAIGDVGGAVRLPLAPGRYTNQHNFGRSGSMWARHHTGNDFSAPCGTPVRAVTGGVAVADPSQAAWAGPHFVKILTGQRSTATWYAHMGRAAVTSGQRVQAGEVIGYVGSLGNSSGCHLHLEVHPKNGGYAQDEVDPNAWLRQKGLRP
ncbi:peptidoglycan DD-metalloendopeptidase family protein [Aeromicrobium massiliense]|uniref:peptidoglycan DD-metalloendopeptidase family protein n=1 Tax=Aeromicrobium massiliense TaxID=1464554 RepID=UPI0009DA06BE|nr:peptidoglycan DD-metalloendopeptidase family protein [Aeromicrobium massiliense]